MRHTIIILTLALVFTSAPSFAHPGGVDKNGGHVDAKTGKYHLHTKPEPKKPEAKKPAAPKKK